MIEALLLAMAQPPMSAIDAERAFVADAQKLGQWTAFRKWAADDATMFLPHAGSAHDWLKDKADPPVAVFWWPGRSFVSCDGNTAANTGPWVRGWGKSVGYFTTVWKRQADGGWKWALDHGDALKTSRAEGGDIASRRASCKGRPVKDRFVLTAAVGATIGEGVSNDGSLHWAWIVEPSGSRQVVVRIWNGTGFETVIHDRVTAE